MCKCAEPLTPPKQQQFVSEKNTQPVLNGSFMPFLRVTISQGSTIDETATVARCQSKLKMLHCTVFWTHKCRFEGRKGPSIDFLIYETPQMTLAAMGGTRRKHLWRGASRVGFCISKASPSSLHTIPSVHSHSSPPQDPKSRR